MSASLQQITFEVTPRRWLMMTACATAFFLFYLRSSINFSALLITVCAKKRWFTVRSDPVYSVGDRLDDSSQTWNVFAFPKLRATFISLKYKHFVTQTAVGVFARNNVPLRSLAAPGTNWLRYRFSSSFASACQSVCRMPTRIVSCRRWYCSFSRLFHCSSASGWMTHMLR